MLNTFTHSAFKLHHFGLQHLHQRLTLWSGKKPSTVGAPVHQTQDPSHRTAVQPETHLLEGDSKFTARPEKRLACCCPGRQGEQKTCSFLNIHSSSSQDLFCDKLWMTLSFLQMASNILACVGQWCRWLPLCKVFACTNTVCSSYPQTGHIVFSNGVPGVQFLVQMSKTEDKPLNASLRLFQPYK